MILPIYAYGHPILKKVAEDITPDFPGLQELLANMWDTMYNADGVGIAAPQVGVSARIFLVDTHPKEDEEKEKKEKKEEPKEPPVKMTFFNAHKVEDTGKDCSFEEGCLSIPDIRGDVDRPEQVRLRYLDENFQPHEALFSGVLARVIQHEYDHLEGVLFTERLKPIKKQLIKRKMEKIRNGLVKTDYKMKFAIKR